MQYFLGDIEKGSAVLGLIIIGCTKKQWQKKKIMAEFTGQMKKGSGKQLSI